MDLQELTIVCSGLGCTVEDIDGGSHYEKGENCLENLKDLQRFLRRDNPETRDVFMQLGQWNTVKHDLIPLVLQYRGDYELVLNALKVIVFLTMPIDPASQKRWQQLEYLCHFKVAFLDNDVIAVILAHLEQPLEHLESGNIAEDDWKMMQLILTLFRNLLSVQEPTSIDALFLHLKDRFLQCIFQESVGDLLLALLQHVEGKYGMARRDNFLFLEIFYHIFRGQQPDVIATIQTAEDGLEASESKQHSSSLRHLINEEKKELKNLRFKDLPRHSRFSGMFVRIGQDGSKTILTRNPFQSPLDNVTKHPSAKRGPMKRMAQDDNVSLPSEKSVCKLLKNFAEQFLEAGYNMLMQTVKEDIHKERSGIQDTEIVMFLEVAHFITSYQRHIICSGKSVHSSDDINGNNESISSFQGKICGPISCTMDDTMFTLVISKWSEYFESAKQTNHWTSLTAAGTLLRDMIFMLDLVFKKSDCVSEQETRVARILLLKIFYDQTEHGILNLLMHSIKGYDTHMLPRSYLVSLVETTHIVFRLLETVTQQEGALRVRKKARKTKSRRKAKDIEHDSQPIASGNEANIGAELSLANGHMDTNEIRGSQTNDQETDISLDRELENTNCLQTEHGAEPITSGNEANTGAGSSVANGLLDSNERTGSQTDDQGNDLSLDMELQKTNCPQNIVGANGGQVGQAEQVPKSHSVTDEPGSEIGEKTYKHNELEDVRWEEDDDDSSNDEIGNETQETSLDVKRCIGMFADNTIVSNYCWLLRYCTANSAATNYYILRMLKRICDDYGLEPMLYQLSLLQIFHGILSDKRITTSKEHQGLVAFLTKLIRNLFKKIQSNRLLFIELLFWKTRRECHEITADYTIQKIRGSSNRGSKQRQGIADALGEDEDDIGQPCSLGDDQRDSEVTGAELLAGKVKRVNQRKSKVKAGLFSEEQEVLIRELFEQHKENRRCSRLIAQALDASGKYTVAQVSRKLKQLGLKRAVANRKSNIDLDGSDNDHEGKSESTADSDSSIHGDDNDDHDDDMEDGITLGELLNRRRFGSTDSRKEKFLDIDDNEPLGITLSRLKDGIESRSNESAIQSMAKEMESDVDENVIQKHEDLENANSTSTSTLSAYGASQQFVPKRKKRLIHSRETELSEGSPISAEGMLMDNDKGTTESEADLTLLDQNSHPDADARLSHARKKRQFVIFDDE